MTFNVRIALSAGALALIAYTPVAGAAGAKITYSTVAEARVKVPALLGAKIQNTQDGWFIVNLPGPVAWSFTPSQHEAHPSVGKRVLIEKDGKFFIETQLLCQASKAACDRLHSSYLALDAKTNESMRKNNSN